MPKHRNLRILVVGKDPLTADLVIRMIKQSGMNFQRNFILSEAEIFCFPTGDAPDVVIIDGDGIPDRNAFRRCERLRKFSPSPRIKFLYLGSHVSEATIERVRALGGVDVLLKPVTYERLVSKLRSLLGTRPDDM